jgi:molybdenum cofactor cytidylyltransferase
VPEAPRLGWTVVLGAGRGDRLGGPKALLRWRLEDGRELPLGAAHAVVRLEHDSSRVLVVVRDAVARVLASWLPAGAESVCSEAPDALGPAGSLAAAAQTLAGVDPEQLLLVTPVDCPPVPADAAKALLEALAASPRLRAVRPRFEGRGGHPVAMRASLLACYRAPDPPMLRSLLGGLGRELLELALDEPAVRADLDSPADWRALGRGEPSFVLGPRQS